jgi:hypothetical protein
MSHGDETLRTLPDLKLHTFATSRQEKFLALIRVNVESPFDRIGPYL